MWDIGFLSTILSSLLMSVPIVIAYPVCIYWIFTRQGGAGPDELLN